MMEKTTLAHKSEVKSSNWQPPTHAPIRRHGSQSSCNGCGACRRITSSTSASASLMLKSLDPGKKVCATRFLQSTHGNRYVQRLIQTKKDSPCLERCGSRAIQMKASGCCGGCANHGKEEEEASIQTELTIGRPGDKYEQEADRVADSVMRMPEPQVRRQPEEEEEEIQMKSLSEQITPLVQRQPIEEEEEELQAKEVSDRTPEVAPNLETDLNTLRGGGQPLPEIARNFMETRFGSDFSGVRVHTNGDAVQMNRELNAEAFTHGRDIYFGAGRYTPGTAAGKRLIAHELAHVVQQNPSRVQTKYSGLSNRPVRIQAVASDAAVLQRWSIGAPVPGINTIVCNGSGGIAVQAGATGNAQQTACLKNCIVRHEKSHRTDALAENTKICKGQGAGKTVRPSRAQRSATEIKASNVEISCLKTKLPRASKVCKPIINARMTQMEAYRDSF